MKKKIKKITAEFLEHMLVFDAKVKVVEVDGLFEISFDIQSPGVLIGKNGETMRAIEQILRLLISKKIKEPINISLDIAGYKDKIKKEIEEMGLRAAKSAIKTGQAQVLLPMNGFERRLVHLVLKEFKDIETESIGEEPNRRVVIKAKKKVLV